MNYARGPEMSALSFPDRIAVAKEGEEFSHASK
jgi:hypothetical protein